MTGRWKVCKRDGVWCAFDRDGDLRHAGNNWRQVITFALMGAEEPAIPETFTHPAVYTPHPILAWFIAMRLRQELDKDDEQ